MVPVYDIKKKERDCTLQRVVICSIHDAIEMVFTISSNAMENIAGVLIRMVK
jgi:hypothetical protein